MATLPRSYLPSIALVDYPAQFPLPDRSPYGYAVDMGLIRSEMAAGNARQRRTFRHMPTTFALTFHMHTTELYQWQQWANAYAYDWFNLPLADMYAGAAGELITPQAARFIGNLEVALDGHDWFAVTVPAELHFGLLATVPDPTQGGWIVGGTPPAPSPDWTLAGNPHDPARNWIDAGSPEFPGAPPL